MTRDYGLKVPMFHEDLVKKPRVAQQHKGIIKQNNTRSTNRTTLGRNQDEEAPKGSVSTESASAR